MKPLQGIIQVAGIRNLEEALLLAEEGVDFLGFPLRLAVHREDLSETAAARIIAQLPETVKAVLITYLTRAGEILDLVDFLQVKIVQLHGEIEPSEVAALKNRRPEIALIKSLIVKSANFLPLQQEVELFAPWCDFFITDTYDPDSSAMGATGKTHDWRISRRLREISPRPLILAGGLHPDNVAEAIRQVRPAGVDVHTGVEDRQGAKDPHLVRRFVRRARTAFAAL